MEVPSIMRIAQYSTASGGLDKNLKINEIPVPTTIKPGSTLVKVAYTSLNPADYKIAESIMNYAYKKPATPGLDFAGIVVRTTREDLISGQRVFGNIGPDTFGALAEYIVVDSKGLVPLPDSVSFQHAACIGVAGITAYQSLAPYAPRRVFINGGSGGTGTFGIQEAKAMGAYVVTSCSTDNVQLCKKLGADVVIDYRKQDLMTELKKHQFDLVVDNVFASVDPYFACDQFTAPKARYVTIGGEPSLSTFWRFVKVYLIPGLLGGGKRPFTFFTTNINQKDLLAVGEWMEQGKVKAVIDEEFDLADINQAFTKLKRGRTKGKIVIKIAKDL